MLNYNFKLTEEIARFAYEKITEDSEDWFIAFTNPTAGPWKKIMAPPLQGCGIPPGEVYRFQRDSQRPDLVLVSDKHQVIIIIEAKDSLSKLITQTQLKKSAKVALELASRLHGDLDSQLKESEKISTNPFWAERTKYRIVAGLLWGAEEATPEEGIKEAATLFFNHLQDATDKCSPLIVCIESLKNVETQEIACNHYVIEKGKDTVITANTLLDMLPKKV